MWEVAEKKFQEKLIPTNGFIRRYTPENRNSVMLHTDTFDYSAVILLTPRSKRIGGELFVYPLETLSSRLKGDFLTAILQLQSVIFPEKINVSSKLDANSDYEILQKSSLIKSVAMIHSFSWKIEVLHFAKHCQISSKHQIVAFLGRNVFSGIDWRAVICQFLSMENNLYPFVKKKCIYHFQIWCRRTRGFCKYDNLIGSNQSDE